MSAMQLNSREPTIRHQPGSINKLPNDSVYISLRHLPRRRKGHRTDKLIEAAFAEFERNRTGCNRLPKDPPSTSNPRRLPTRMTSLNNTGGSMFLACLCVCPPLAHESRIPLLVRVFGGHCNVKGCSEMVYIYLDISCFDSAYYRLGDGVP